MAKLIFTFDSADEGSTHTNIVSVYDDGTYYAEGVAGPEPSLWKVEDGLLYFKHHSCETWNRSANEDLFTIPFLKKLDELVEKELLDDAQEEG